MPNKLPDTITRNAMAALLQVSPQRVSQLTAAGVLKRSADGGYVVAGSVGAYADFRARSVAKRHNQNGMDGIKQRQLERLTAQIEREQAELITMKEATETLEHTIGMFLESFRSIPSRLEEGSSLRIGLERAMPAYVAELEKELREPLKALKAA